MATIYVDNLTYTTNDGAKIGGVSVSEGDTVIYNGNAYTVKRTGYDAQLVSETTLPDGTTRGEVKSLITTTPAEPPKPTMVSYQPDVNNNDQNFSSSQGRNVKQVDNLTYTTKDGAKIGGVPVSEGDVIVYNGTEYTVKSTGYDAKLFNSTTMPDGTTRGEVKSLITTTPAEPPKPKIEYYQPENNNNDSSVSSQERNIKQVDNLTYTTNDGAKIGGVPVSEGDTIVYNGTEYTVKRTGYDTQLVSETTLPDGTIRGEYKNLITTTPAEPPKPTIVTVSQEDYVKQVENLVYGKKDGQVTLDGIPIKEGDSVSYNGEVYTVTSTDSILHMEKKYINQFGQEETKGIVVPTTILEPATPPEPPEPVKHPAKVFYDDHSDEIQKISEKYGMNLGDDSYRNYVLKTISGELYKDGEISSSDLISRVDSKVKTIADYASRHYCSSFEEAEAGYNSLIESSALDIPWVGVDQFRFDGTGDLVLSDSEKKEAIDGGYSSSTYLSKIFEDKLNEFYGADAKLTKEAIKSENWLEKSEMLLVDAQAIVDSFQDFVDNFQDIDGELGQALMENLNLSLDDLKTLKQYISDNVSRAMDVVDILKAKVEEEEELNKEIEKITLEKENYISSHPEPPRTIECQHKYVDETGEIQKRHHHDDNPEYNKWHEIINNYDHEINELQKLLEENLKVQVQCIADIEVLNRVVIKFNESPHWQSYLSR